MMSRGSKGAVLGGVLACAGAVHAQVHLNGAVQAVETTLSLMNVEHEELRRTAEAVDAQWTPGVSNHYTTALQAVLDKIVGDLKPTVRAAQSQAQQDIDEALIAVKETEAAAVKAKMEADDLDGALFACVSKEFDMKQFHETEAEKLEAAQADEEKARALKEQSRPLSFDGSAYQKSFECNLGVNGACARQKAIMMTSMRKMLDDAKASIAAKNDYFTDMKKALSAREAETKAAETAMNAASENHESHRNKCQAAKLRRDKAICEYGDTVQAKGVEENDFKAVTAGLDGEASEADRMKEWSTLSHMECMLKKGIAKALEGPINANDHKECKIAALLAVDRKAAEFDKLAKSHANEARTISFGNGQEWKVSGDGEKATDYSKQQFSVELVPSADEQPFKMCPDENGNWGGIVAERLVAASKAPKKRWEGVVRWGKRRMTKR